MSFLGLYTHFEFNPLLVPIDSVDFIKLDSKVLNIRCEHIPVFKKSISVGFGFKLIPLFPNYAINLEGEVISIYNGTKLKVRLNPYGYPCVSVYDPDKYRMRDVAVHILLARTHIKNPEPDRKFYINHIDGNKSNNNLKNLEWVTPQENVLHSRDTGLQNFNSSGACKVYDLLLNKTTQFDSLRLALDFCGIRKFYKGRKKNIKGTFISRVYLKRYIILNPNEVPNFNCNPHGACTYFDKNKGPYQAYNVESGVVTDGDTISFLSEIVSVPYDHIRKIIESTLPTKSLGYYFRIKSEESWPVEFKELISLKKRSFVVKKINSGLVMHVESLSKLLKLLKTTSLTITKVLSSDGILNGWEIEEK